VRLPERFAAERAALENGPGLVLSVAAERAVLQLHWPLGKSSCRQKCDGQAGPHRCIPVCRQRLDVTGRSAAATLAQSVLLRDRGSRSVAGRSCPPHRTCTLVLPYLPHSEVRSTVCIVRSTEYSSDQRTSTCTCTPYSVLRPDCILLHGHIISSKFAPIFAKQANAKEPLHQPAAPMLVPPPHWVPTVISQIAARRRKQNTQVGRWGQNWA
jgi:hypothetical protein